MPTTADLPAILDYYRTSIAAAFDPMPSRTIVQPGAEVAWDACCPDGQLWVRIVRIEPILPTVPRADGNFCAQLGWRAFLAAGLIRCVAVVDDRGRAPSAEAVTNDGLKLAADIFPLQQAIACAGYTQGMGIWTPLGPQGGCAGGEQEFTIRLDACGCPDPAPAE